MVYLLQMKRKLSEEIDKHFIDLTQPSVAGGKEFKVNPSYSTFDGLSTRMPGGQVINGYRFIPITLIGTKQFVYTYDTVCAQFFGFFGAGTGTHPYIPPAPTQVQVTSTDVNDTLAGTGAQRVRVYGYDGNFNFIFEDLDMAGNLPSASTLAYFRFINCVVIQTASVSPSLPPNLGNIYISPAGEPLGGFGIPVNKDRIMAIMFQNTGASLSTNVSAPPGSQLLINKLQFTTGMEVNNKTRVTLNLKANTGQSGFKVIGQWFTSQENQTIHLESNTLPNLVVTSGVTDLIATVFRDSGGGMTDDVKCSLFVDCYLVFPVT